MRRLALKNENDFVKELARIGCAPEALPIFKKKLNVVPLKVDSLSCASANILKQTALSVGADCVISADVISGKKKRSDSIILATLRQYEEIARKLSYQHSGLAKLSEEIRKFLQGERRRLMKFRNYTYNLRERTHIMGILNFTPDSFYDQGRYFKLDSALLRAEKMEEEGADFIDIGAESTRPGSKPISAKEEIDRLKPLLPLIRKRIRVPISVDTYKSETARFALEEGCEIINDISGLRFDPKMAPLLARYRSYVVIMHIKGRPQTMQKNPRYSDLMAEIYNYLKERIDYAKAGGIKEERIIVDPGIGFGKRLEDNYEILRRLEELKGLGAPILVGPSRKSFIGLTLNLPAEERLEGTIAACVLAVLSGANILRVHDVKEIKRAVKMAEAIIGIKN